jgi:predicted nucleic acid-binding protein
VTYLLDTNVLSELRKGPRCNPRVASWFAGVDDQDLGLSVLVIGEIRRGIERLRRRDPRRAGGPGTLCEQQLEEALRRG